MIKKLIGAAFFILIGAVLGYVALGHHVVVTQDETLYIPKTAMALKDTYVNVSDWSAAEFTDHPELVRALVKSGHGDVVPAQAMDKLGEVLQGVLDDVLGGEK
jgi:hypothetical protein